MNDTHNPYKSGTMNAGLWDATHPQTLTATPMTDATLDQFNGDRSVNPIGPGVFVDLARKLELDRADLVAALNRHARDRAALIAALEAVLTTCDFSTAAGYSAAAPSREVLAAIRATLATVQS